MTSWPAVPAYAPAPGAPSSDSRSPRRRESYPDPAATAAAAAAYPVPGPPYRDPVEWDDHRKAWDEYYDRRAMGRSRSPTGDEGTRKRRRSASPYERDRFDPRPRYGDDYDTHSRAYGYTSPRRGGYHGAPPPPVGGARRPPMDPYLMEPGPASLRQYADWFRYFYPNEAKEEDNADRAAEKEAGKRTRDGIRTRWEKYKKQYTANQLQTLFDHHKKSPWFSEKYNPAPEWVNMRARVRKQGWKGHPAEFLKELEEGKYDPKPESEKEAPTVEDDVAVKTATNPEDMDGVEEGARENGPDSPTKSETNGKPDRARRDDEVLVTPDGQCMAIRTIPPDIGRQKIEEACRSVPGFIHLALGEPLQKKNYYRAGWIKFKDDTDMQAALQAVGEKKIEGFKLHVHHVARPFYTRMRVTPEVASTPERLEKDLQQAKQLAAVLEDEYVALRQVSNGAEPKIEDKRNITKEEEGGDVAMTDEMEEDDGPIEKGSEMVERRIEKLTAEMNEQDDAGLETKKTGLALDMYLGYLRAAFNTCYYCAAVCDHVEELHRKCPKHLRRPVTEKASVAVVGDEAGEEKEREEREKEEEEKVKTKEKDGKERHDRRWERNDERWQEWVDSKMALLINRGGIDPTEYGGKNYDEELTKAVEPHTKQEDEGKFRCRTCQKLFKATAFVEKHVANKHPELVRQLEELPFFNNFALDPHRIQPFAHPPTGNNASTVIPPQAYGLQGTYGYGGPEYRGMAAGAVYGTAYGGYGGYGGYTNGGHGEQQHQHQQQQQQQHFGGIVHWTPRREEGPGTRRLQERVGGYATGTVPLRGVEGLPAKPMAAEPVPRRGRPGSDGKEDPRAAAGKKVSYHDMDDVAEGDVELTY